MNRPACHLQTLDSPGMNNICIHEQQSPIRRRRTGTKKGKASKEKLLPLSPLISTDTNSGYSPSILKNKYFSPTKVTDILFDPSRSNDDDDNESTTSSKVSFVGGDVSERRHYDPKTSPISICPPMPILFAFSKTAKRRRSLELYSSMISTTSSSSKSLRAAEREVAATVIQASVRGHRQYQHYQSNKTMMQIQRTQMLQIVTLENELQRIQTRHADELARVENDKHLERNRIYNDVFQEFEQESLRNDALLQQNIGMIHEMRLENKTLRQQNQAMQVANFDMAQKNNSVLQMTDEIHGSIAVAEQSQATFQADFAQIQEIAQAWQVRLHQFETTRDEIEDRLQTEHVIQKSTVRTIRNILRHVNQTLVCGQQSDPVLAKSITDTALASMEVIARDRSPTESPHRVQCQSFKDHLS
jgi:hypothetical protein